MKLGTWMVLAMLSAGLLVGCGDKKEDASKEGAPAPAAIALAKATTPELAMKNIQQALLAGDNEAFVTCFKATEKEKEMLAMVGDMTTSMLTFQNAMEKEYGEEGKKGMGSSVGDMRKDNWADSFDVTIEEDSATATPKDGKGKKLELVKVNDAWLLTAPSMGKEFSSDEEREKSLAQLKVMTDVIKGAQEKVGKEGYTAKKINEEMMMEMMAIMMPEGGMGGE
jgi:hypothetical protein